MHLRAALPALAFLLAVPLGAQVHFRHAPMQELIAQARQERRLLFVDVYTQWCGPCKFMADTVFSRCDVGDFYNRSFVNVKVDAESAEGAAFAKAHGVRSFPTYLFIDPERGEVVHRSSSRQDAEDFMATGRQALDPGTRSPLLEKRYADGDRSPAFLRTYIRRQARIHGREALERAVGEYFSLPGVRLEEAENFELFEKHVHGLDHPRFGELMAGRAALAQAFGEARVDLKVREECLREGQQACYPAIYTRSAFHREDWVRLRGRIEAMPFRGKAQVLDQLDLIVLLGDGRTGEADQKVQAMMARAARGEDAETIMGVLTSVVRMAASRDFGPAWRAHCLEYAQFVAYNSRRRDDAPIHFEYVRALEDYIRGDARLREAFPVCIGKEPRVGKKVYDLRDPDLKPKPRH